MALAFTSVKHMVIPHYTNINSQSDLLLKNGMQKNHLHSCQAYPASTTTTADMGTVLESKICSLAIQLISSGTVVAK